MNSNQADRRILGRSDNASPRKPQRRNGHKKYEKLLDALEALITEQNPNEISLIDLAQAAGVPVASVYHFFPSVGASLTALAERHYESFGKVLLEYSDFAPVESWQGFLNQLCDLVCSYYQGNISALRVHFGPQSSWALRQLQMSNNRRLANVLIKNLSRKFDLPSSRDWCDHVINAININDCFLSHSYSYSGGITSEAVTEGKLAAAAYLKLYLGELLQPRKTSY
ncbi:TetR/AcrR family transcriptional regulator [Microbulbifer variabilis]|uniref:TetR/AcrR family transcriptional regulator n=1 Tax=Microbulbifer variabilis TaxID=266805 RepID=UPI001CFC68CF|nr:TetR/AcrR family transcriptional regulator [Microbulbifer variabilis]